MINHSISTLSIPADLSYIAPSIAYVTELVRGIRFNEKEISHITISLEEAMINVIQFGYENRSSEGFEVIFDISNFSLTMTIKEKGIPFNPERLPEYQPNRPDQDKKGAGLGLHLIKSLIDEVWFIRKGRHGQEIKLIQYLKEKHIHNMLSEREEIDSWEKAGTEPVKGRSIDYSLRPMRPEEAVQVSVCAYKCYGYSYEDYIYYPERLVALNDEGALFSLLAVGEEDNILGHSALKFPWPQAPIAESGVAFVYPEYRRLGLFKKFNLYFLDYARKVGLSGLYGRPVTSHVASQRMSAGCGYKDCCLSLGAFPADLEFRKIRDIVSQRESLLTSFIKVRDVETRDVYVPANIQPIVGRLFQALDIPVLFASSGTIIEAPDGRSIIETSVNQAINAASIKVYHGGPQALEELRLKEKSLCLDRIDYIQLVLNLEDPSTEALIPKAETLGFFFSGILPFGINGRHALILQYLNNISIDLDQLKLLSPESHLILDHIKKTTGL